ncbi:MAG: phosphoribosylanthranilate isomerase [Phycisphaeraceae bacterium]|nr:phosphoribosylanthranilate isomerase [Phycisphaeraceae bacterium]MBX3367601.1 phosphoribosylanthranilate isomerase [Phycisphaeraceae bacterium]
MPRTRIKICGIRDIDSAIACANAGADAIGFVFVKASPRAITPDEAFEIQASLPPFLSTVGLFKNASLDFFCDAEETCPTTMVQLHGDESDQLIQQCGPNLIKAIKFDAATIAKDLARLSKINEVDAILVDGSSGGEGIAFDWSALKPHADALDLPLIVSGGLTPDNVADAIRILRPFAVDVSSGVESAPGVKDPALIHAFCDAVRKADAQV